MVIAHSKLTAQGRISVPAEVQRRLGLVPGSVIEWAEEGGAIVARRSGRSSSAGLRRAVFPDGPPERRTLAGLKEGIRQHMRQRHPRR